MRLDYKKLKYHQEEIKELEIDKYCSLYNYTNNNFD